MWEPQARYFARLATSFLNHVKCRPPIQNVRETPHTLLFHQILQKLVLNGHRPWCSHWKRLLTEAHDQYKGSADAPWRGLAIHSSKSTDHLYPRSVDLEQMISFEKAGRPPWAPPTNSHPRGRDPTNGPWFSPEVSPLPLRWQVKNLESTQLLNIVAH